MNFHRIRQGFIYWLTLALLGITGRSAIGDSHDDIVFQRYSHKVTPGKIHYDFDMKFTELARPATQQDVEKGAAVFTFEGLGPSRVWKLPECPMFCEWPSLKDFPFEGQAGPSGTNFDNSGYVCQAEELQVNGQWKRYFGFVCKHGVAVVPAEEIYLWFNDCCPTPSITWNQLPGGVDLGVLGPDAKMQKGAVVPVKLNIGDPLLVELHLRNRRGAPQSVLCDIYRDDRNGGPAFHEGIILHLDWAPFDAKNPNRNYPQMENFRPVSAIRTNFFRGGDTGPILATGETSLQGVFNIRDWFNVAVPGYYQYHFEFNPALLGLPTDEGNGGGIYMGFKVGLEPRQLTVEELNRDIPAFGGLANEAKIRALLKQSFGSSYNRSDLVQQKQKSLPQLDHTPIPSENGPPDEPDIVGLWIANNKLLEKLKLEGTNQFRTKLEALMDRENDLPLKLLLASEAAPLGSEQAALFLLDSMKNTDYKAVANTHTALRFALSHYEKNPPDWLEEMAIAALSDDRYVTGLEKTGWSSDTLFTVSYMADEDGELTWALGRLKCTNAVPFLIEMAKKTNGRRGPVMALGIIGDQRAIPVLIDFVKQKGPSTTLKAGQVLNDDFLRPVEALGNLHAKAAIPVLLDYIQFPDVIEALEQIGDSRVIKPLQKLILANGKIAGVPTDAELERERVAEAKIAVASLDSADRTTKLCELLTDASLNQYQRRSVVWRLGEHPDPRAVPFLAKAVKTDPSGAVVNQAITVMAVFKYKAAVDALIDCFDADFTGKRDWKRAYKPEMFQDNIADSLRTLTGQQISTNKKQWLKWWKDNRDLVPGLK